MILHGKSVLLRPPRYDEHRRLVRLRNENLDCFYDQKPITLESHLKWYDDVRGGARWWGDVECLYCIVLCELVIGTIGLIDFAFAAGYAEYGRFVIAAPWRRRGYGTDALATLLHHAFLDLGVECVYGHVLAHNEAALALDRRLGFRDHGSRSIAQDQVAIRMQIGREDFLKWLATTLS